MRQTKQNIKTEATETAPAHNSAQARYTQLESDRQPYLQRARRNAELTIPALLPPEGSDGFTNLAQPWSSLGAKGVNNLASKLAILLFPPEGSFFRFTVDEFTLDKLLASAEDGGEDAQDIRGEIDAAFGKVERAITQRIEERGVRMQMFEACKHLVVAGNILVQVLKDEAVKLHRLDRFAVKRDQAGTVVEIVVKESVGRSTLDDEVQAIIQQAAEKDKAELKDNVDIYTWVRREGKKWAVFQEVMGEPIPSSVGTYPLDKSPWIPVRLIAVDGEDYGRGYVDEHTGDLSSYDGLMQAIIEGAAISSRMIPIVNEGGVTSIKDINEARNGEAVQGNANDIKFLQVEKFADLSVAERVAEALRRELQQSFLLIAGVQRNAERVTAEEIRLIAQELEVPFGGAYPSLAQDWQKPMASRLLFQMQKRKELPALPDKNIKLQIVTGLAGLGRYSEVNRWDALIAGANQMFPPEEVALYVSVGGYLQRKATALALDTKGVIRSEKDVQAQKQAQMQNEMSKAAIGPVANVAKAQMAEQEPQQ